VQELTANDNTFTSGQIGVGMNYATGEFDDVNVIGSGGATQYTLTVNTSGSGSVALNPSGGTYDENTVVTLTANPSSGCWKLDSWSGDLSGSANPETITMNEDKSVTATFSETNISQRINSRTFPSVFQAWGGATNMAPEDSDSTIARHDLVWNGIGDIDGLVWDTDSVGGYRVLATGFTEASIDSGLAFRQKLLGYNPNMVLLANMTYRGAKETWLPDDHEWWMRDGNGDKIVSWTGGGVTWYRLDFTNSDFRTQVATWAASAVNSGVYDGVLLDWWDETISSEWPSRLALLQEVRNAITDTCLIIVNANDRQSTGSAPYINGVFMEIGTKTTRADNVQRWNEVQDALVWNQSNVLEPKLVCLEIWYVDSMDEPYRMRATTTLSLTLSNGYCLFAEPNEAAGVDHKHWWWDFWDKSLGEAVGDGSLQGNGAYMREFDNGYAVYNPMGNGQVTVTFPVNYTSVATGNTQKTHNVADQDGDIFLLAIGKAVPMPQQQTPVEFSLSQNYPNPFNPVTNIKFSVPDAGNVNLSVYNMLGEKVKTLVDIHKTAGEYSVEWNGTNNAGREMSSGVYFYKLQMGSNIRIKKMLFMK